MKNKLVMIFLFLSINLFQNKIEAAELTQEEKENKLLLFPFNLERARLQATQEDQIKKLKKAIVTLKPLSIPEELKETVVKGSLIKWTYDTKPWENIESTDNINEENVETLLQASHQYSIPKIAVFFQKQIPTEDQFKDKNDKLCPLILSTVKGWYIPSLILLNNTKNKEFKIFNLDISAQNKLGQTALNLGIEEGDLNNKNIVKTIKLLINNIKPISLRTKNNEGNTALHSAIKRLAGEFPNAPELKKEGIKNLLEIIEILKIKGGDRLLKEKNIKEETPFQIYNAKQEEIGKKLTPEQITKLKEILKPELEEIIEPKTPETKTPETKTVETKTVETEAPGIIKTFPITEQETLNKFIEGIAKAKKESSNANKINIIKMLVQQTGIPEEFQGAKLEKENWENITDIDGIIQNALEFLLYIKLEKLDDYLSANFKWSDWLKGSIITPLIEEGKLNLNGARPINIDIKLKRKENEIFDVLIKINQITPIKNLSVIHQNKFKRVPDAISDLKEIEILDFSKNNIKELPTTIANLEKLQTLNLSNNKKLNKIPKEIIEWGKQEGHSLNIKDTKFIELQEKTEKIIKEAIKAIEEAEKIGADVSSAKGQLNGEEGALKKFKDGEFADAEILANTAKDSALKAIKAKQKEIKGKEEEKVIEKIEIPEKPTPEIAPIKETEIKKEIEKEKTKIKDKKDKEPIKEEPEWKLTIKELEERATAEKILKINQKEKEALIEWAKTEINKLPKDKRTAIRNSVRISVRKRRDIEFKKAIAETIFATSLMFKQLYHSNQIDILKEATE